jgi:hypothetical protein
MVYFIYIYYIYLHNIFYSVLAVTCGSEKMNGAILFNKTFLHTLFQKIELSFLSDNMRFKDCFVAM